MTREVKRRGAARHEREQRRPAKRARVTLAPALDPLHPANLLAVTVATLCVAFSVSVALFDTDMWQHFAVGRAIWQLHAIPTQQLWTWPNYGTPDVNASWGFRLLIWPVWHALGVPGLDAWRWITTLAAFALLWLAARKMGARGLAPLLVASWCALTYRHRAQIRPESLVAILLAAEIWVLESVRNAVAAGESVRAPLGAALRRDPRIWLVPIALIWTNVHISFWLGLAVQAIYLVGSRGAPGAEAAAPGTRRPNFRVPLAILGLSALISFVNPWGWKAVWQPADYFLHWRHEPIYQTIGELRPIDWANHARDGLPILIAGWLVLMLGRTRRFGLDRVEALMFVLFTALALPAERFIGFFVLAALPFVARDLDAWVRSRSSSGRLGPWPHALLVGLACVAIGLPEWMRPDVEIGLRIDPRAVPVQACDFIQAHGVRGHGFNQFASGGYLLDRFWPDRGRLPFMDIHQSGSRADRDLYAAAQQNRLAWHALDDKYRFDFAVIYTHRLAGDYLLDFLDADSSWALVSSDDIAALYVRREGGLANIARDFGYRRLPGGTVPAALMEACGRDTSVRRELEADLERSISGSEWNGRAMLLLAPLRMMEGREAEASGLLDHVIRQSPRLPGVHAARGEIELVRGHGAAARADFESERRLSGESSSLDHAMGRAFAHDGDRAAARIWYARALRRDPTNRAAADSLTALDSASR